MSTIVLLLVALAVKGVASSDWLYLTANNYVRGVCADGQRLSLPEYPYKKHKIGSTELPDDWQAVTVHAENRKGKAGLLAYVRSGSRAGVQTTCKPIILLPNGTDCCSWVDVDGTLKTSPVGRPYKKEIPRPYEPSIVWSAAPYKNVCCRLSKCPPACANCRWSGPDRCDKCAIHSTFDPETKLCSVTCQVEIDLDKLEVVSWDARTPELKFTWNLLDYHRQAAILGSRWCNFISRITRNATSEFEVTAQSGSWNLGPTYANLLAVDLYLNVLDVAPKIIFAEILPGYGETPYTTVAVGFYRRATFSVNYYLDHGFTVEKSEGMTMEIVEA